MSRDKAVRRRGAGVESADSFWPLHSPRTGTAGAGAPALFSFPSSLSAEVLGLYRVVGVLDAAAVVLPARISWEIRVDFDDFEDVPDFAGQISRLSRDRGCNVEVVDGGIRISRVAPLNSDP